MRSFGIVPVRRFRKRAWEADSVLKARYWAPCRFNGFVRPALSVNGITLPSCAPLRRRFHNSRTVRRLARDIHELCCASFDHNGNKRRGAASARGAPLEPVALSFGASSHAWYDSRELWAWDTYEQAVLAFVGHCRDAGRH